MDTRAVARADQIQAVLREASGPLPSPVLYMACGRPGRHTWGYIETLFLLDALLEVGAIAVHGQPCCVNHASWILPEDR